MTAAVWLLSLLAWVSTSLAVMTTLRLREALRANADLHRALRAARAMRATGYVDRVLSEREARHLGGAE